MENRDAFEAKKTDSKHFFENISGAHRSYRKDHLHVSTSYYARRALGIKNMLRTAPETHPLSIYNKNIYFIIGNLALQSIFYEINALFNPSLASRLNWIFFYKANDLSCN